uniref:Retinol dehydrogenase 12 n=1 Tax=Anopheles coluzzii TaxID=1518534 RepID=A0A8W7P6B6_ANOCL
MTNQEQQQPGQQQKHHQQQAIAITIRDTCTTSEGVTGERKVKLIVNRSSPVSSATRTNDGDPVAGASAAAAAVPPKFFQGGQFKNKDIRLDAKVVIITGANAGIGKEAAIECAKRGARVYMGCRDPARMEKARQEILDKSGSQNVFGLELDLASFESIRSFVKTFLSMERRLHVLINNAGVMACPKAYTKEGFEMHFGTNHLGHFLLTNLLLDVLKRSAPSRVVTVSSLGHKWGRINKDDINAEKDYREWDAYMQSKLCNILFSRHLAKRLRGTGVNTYALHPGAINTELTRHLNPCIRTMAKPIFWVFFKTPKSGAQTTLYCAMEPTIASHTGLYYSDCKLKEPEPHAQDDAMAEWLWNLSERLTGLSSH